MIVVKNRTLIVLLNTATLAITLFSNFASATGFFSNATVASVSYKYDTLFAPAGYAFSIWGLIFLLCIAFVVYEWILLKNDDRKGYIERTGLWFTLSNIANALWLYCWVNEWVGLSVILILILLFSLSALVVKLRMELDDEPVLTIFFVWWPIVIYLGWIMVATIACVAAWFVQKGWQPFDIAKDLWTVTMISVATILFLFLLVKRNLREAALVGVWAFIAIAVRQHSTNDNISTTAMVCAAVLLIATSIHAYKNRKYNIFAKMIRGEWK
jgi:hypothetical protein